MNPKDIIETVELLAKSIAFCQEDVRVNSRIGDSSALITIVANESDASRLIGERGSVYKGLLFFAQEAGNSIDHAIEISPIKTSASKGRHLPAFEADPNWPKGDIERILSRVFTQLFNSECHAKCESAPGITGHVAVIRCSNGPGNTRTARSAARMLSPVVKYLGMANGVNLALDIIL